MRTQLGEVFRSIVCAASSALLSVSSAVAEDAQSGDWAWNVDDDSSYYAYTENSAGHFLMQMCSPDDGKCVYAVGFLTNCEKGSEYPALVNTDKGAYSMEFLCGATLDGGGNLMLVKDFEQIDEIVRSGSRIGFALPMEGDEFKAVRFSLKGSVAALNAMRLLADASASSRSSGRSPRDVDAGTF